MPTFNNTNSIMAAKVYVRGTALPLDTTAVQESVAAASTYAASPTAYAGQILSVLDTDTNVYKIYMLQPGDSGYTLTEFKSGSDAPAFDYVKVVTEDPIEGMVEGCLYINTTDKTGKIYNGSELVQVFKDVSSDVTTIQGTLATMQETIESLAPKDAPVFTTSVTLPGNPTNNLEAAPKQYVDQMISNLVNAAPGVVSSTAPLPSTGYKAGQTWRVAEAGTYAGQTCEVGDLIICVKDFADTQADADFIVVQANINGAVTSSADVATDMNIVAFDGTTGKIIKDSNVSVASLQDAVAKAHEHTNKAVLDSYTSNQEEVLAAADTAAKSYTDDKVTELQTAIEGKADAANVYNKTEIDTKVETINTAIDSKIDQSAMQSYVDSAIEGVKGDTTATIKDIEDKIGDIADGTTVKEYIDTAVGAGGADVADLIAQAKAEAIQESKTYTDTQMAIKTF